MMLFKAIEEISSSKLFFQNSINEYSGQIVVQNCKSSCNFCCENNFTMSKIALTSFVSSLYFFTSQEKNYFTNILYKN